MIIYTNLNPLSVIFARLKDIVSDYNVNLRSGLIDSNSDTEVVKHTVKINSFVVLFWFAKSNKKLSFYRVKESVESIYNGLQVLENHKDIIK